MIRFYLNSILVKLFGVFGSRGRCLGLGVFSGIALGVFHDFAFGTFASLIVLMFAKHFFMAIG
jgi:hypothetical protein